MEQKYPTREEAQGMADHQIAYGFMLLAMHDEIDRLNTCIKRLVWLDTEPHERSITGD